MPLGPGARTYRASRQPEATESFEGTGLKNAVAELEAAGIGHDLTDAERHAMPPLWERAKGVLQADPEAGKRLADDLIANPERGMTDEDSALLLLHKRNLLNALNDAAEKTHTGTPEARRAADRDYMARSSELKGLLDAVKQRGTEWGREGRWRQAMAYEDYSFATQEGLLRAAKGGERLTEAEHAQLLAEVEKHKALSARTEALRLKAEQEAGELRAKAALDKVQREAEAAKAPSKYILDLAQKWVDKWDAAADNARAKLAGKFLSPTPEDLFNLAVIVRSHIAHVGLDLAKITTKLVGEMGEGVRPYIQGAFDKAQELMHKEVDSLPEKVRDPVRKKVTKTELTPEQEQADLVKRITSKLKRKQLDEVTPLVQKLARSFADQGLRGWREITDAVHAVLKPLVPDLDYRDTLDAVTGYGKFTVPDQSEGAKALREAKAEGQTIRKIQDAIARVGAKRTGPQRDLPGPVKRALERIYNNVKRLFPTAGESEAMLRSAFKAKKTRMEHQIEDMQNEIDKRKLTVKNRSDAKFTQEQQAEIDWLQSELDHVKTAHAEIFPEQELTPEQQADRYAKYLDREAARVQEQMASGKIFPPGKRARPTSVEIEAKKAHLEALKAEREYMRESAQPRHTPEEDEANAIMARRDALQKRLDEAERKINTGDVSAPGKAPKPELTPELQAMRDELSQMNEMLAKLRAAARPPLTDAERLSAAKAGIARRKANLLDKMARGDFSPVKRRPPVPLDPEGARNAAELREIENSFVARRRKAERAQRSPAKKAVDLAIDTLLGGPRAIAVMYHGTVGMQTHAGGLATRVASKTVGAEKKQFPININKLQCVHFFKFLTTICAVVWRTTTQGQGSITFDAHPNWIGTYYTESGMAFQLVVPQGQSLDYMGIVPPSTYQGVPQDNNPFMWWLRQNNPYDYVSLSLTSDAQFGLTSVQLADPNSPSSLAFPITFLGFKADGLSVTNVFTTPGGGATTFATYVFSPLFASGLTSVDIIAPRWAMDNLVFTVPEPSSVVLAALGLVVLRVRVVRKQRRS